MLISGPASWWWHAGGARMNANKNRDAAERVVPYTVNLDLVSILNRKISIGHT